VLQFERQHNSEKSSICSAVVSRALTAQENVNTTTQAAPAFAGADFSRLQQKSGNSRNGNRRSGNNISGNRQKKWQQHI
jgi:hypothetical protein